MTPTENPNTSDRQPMPLHCGGMHGRSDPATAMTTMQPKDILLAPPVSASTPIYFCPICHTAYSTPDGAQACADLPTPEQVVTVKPGDFVVVSEGYTWAENNDWVAPVDGPKFNGRPTFSFFYIVMAVTGNNIHGAELFGDNRGIHRPILHLASGGANTATRGPFKGFYAGWAPISGHHIESIAADRVPQKLRDAAAHLIGKTTTSLL